MPTRSRRSATSSESRPASPPAVLLAVTGLSPAILTETVWALARENPPCLPGRVIVLTTQVGARCMEAALFSPLPEFGGATAWEALRKSLGAGPGQLIAEPPRVIAQPDPVSGRTLPLDDIQSHADNETAATFILETVRGLVENPDHRLIASIAGGRKTMGALLHAALTLIGRENDRITHVLVPPPYDSLPGFLFPDQPGGALAARDGSLHAPAEARITLADVPFVPLRNRFHDLGEMPGDFATLVARCSRQIEADAARPIPLRIDHLRGTLEVDGQSLTGVRARALAILHFLLEANQKGQIPKDQPEAAELFRTWHAAQPRLTGHFANPGSITEDDFRRELNHLRELLRHHAWQPAKRTLVQPPFHLESITPADPTAASQVGSPAPRKTATSRPGAPTHSKPKP